MDARELEERMLAYVIAANKAKPPIEYDLHRLRASLMFNVQQHEVTPQQRQAAKLDAYRHLYRS